MGRDGIAVVEAAYSFAVDDRAWLQRVTVAAQPLLDAGLGLSSFFYDLRRPSDAWLDDPIGVDAHPELARAFVAVHRGRSEKERARPYLDPAPVRTSSEIYEASGAAARSGEPGRREAAKLGFADYLRVKAHAGSYGCVIGVPLPRLTTVSRAVAARWKMLTAHLVAALRIRRSFASVEAILDADGRAVLAAPNVTRSALEHLRRSATAIDRARGTSRRDADRALAIWTGLLGGRWSLVDRFDSDGRRFWIARRNGASSPDPRGLTKKEEAVGRALALGHSNKVAAIDLGLAEGTVCAHVASLREKLGAGSRTELVARLRAPAGARAQPMRSAALAREPLVVLSEARPLPPRDDRLTPAEQEVAAAVAEGASNAEVARRRGTSTSTVIGQLQAVYRKLGVQSRVELAALFASNHRAAR